MSKYYNKDIPTEIHFMYGSRQSGKTYRESYILTSDELKCFEKLKEKNK